MRFLVSPLMPAKELVEEKPQGRKSSCWESEFNLPQMITQHLLMVMTES